MTRTELKSYLTKHASLVPLGEKIPTETSGSINSYYPWPWADPNIESQTDAYQVTRHWTLPIEFQEKARQCKSEERRVYANEAEKYLILTSNKTIHVYFYKEEPISIQLTLPQPIQYFKLINKNKSAIGVSTTGQVYYWKDVHEDRFIGCKISLVPSKAQITAISLIDSTRLVLGSSSGDLYLVTIGDKLLVQSTFYKPTTGIVSYITGIFQPHLPHVSQSELPANLEPIVQIKTNENIIYVATKRFLLVWKLHSMTEIELVSHINVSSKIVSSVAQHIPPSQSSEDNIKYEVLDMDLIDDGEIVLLVSYHVPALGMFVQYALISIVLQSFYTEAQVVYATSIPYSAVPSSVSLELRVTRALGFVTLNDTVISVSLDRKSVFEEAVVLRKDQVLTTFIQEYAEYAKAYIYTLNSGVIEFEINIDEIQGQRHTGNLYASVVPSILDRETAIFKSKLEQAVFFGASKQSLLIFPLRPEQMDVARAVKSLSDQIMNMNCKFFPSCESIDLTISSRYFFERRIIILLNENILIEMVPQTIRAELFQRVEFYLLSFMLWKFHQERIEDNVTTIYWESIIEHILTEPKGNSVQDLLINHPFCILSFLNKVRDKFLIPGKETKEQMTLICSVNELMMRLTTQTYRFEKKYRKIYQVPMNQGYPISLQINDMLVSLFRLNVKYIVDNNMDEVIMNSDQMKKIKENLCHLADILLDNLLEALNNMAKIGDFLYHYEDVRKSVIEGLCKSNIYNKAIELAERHHDVYSLVVSVQTSPLSPQDMQEKNKKFIDLFQQEYYDDLLIYLERDSNQNEKMSLSLLSDYPTLATNLLLNRNLKVSWKYYLKQKDYKNALESIQVCIQQELDPAQLKLYNSWMKIIKAALLS